MTLADLRAEPRVVVADSGLKGKAEPRLFTPPHRALTRENTLGYQCIEFAELVLGVRLLPWQRWWLLHALELKPDGTFRFRTILTLVSRQNGKTWLLKVLALWFMYLGHGRLVLGAAQSLDIARESWQGAVDLTQESPELAAEVASIRYANGEQALVLSNGARYRITASSRGSGRGLSVDLLILDELREHRTPEAWAALSKTTMARPNALTVCISNAGDDQSVVLNTLRSAALAEADPGLGLFEWSAPEGCALDDPVAWAQACPGLNHGTITEAAIRTSLATDPPAVFRTELLCQHVPALDSAIDPAAWAACADPAGAGSLAGTGARIALCLDVSLDYSHVSLYGAAVTRTTACGCSRPGRGPPWTTRATRSRRSWTPSRPLSSGGSRPGRRRRWAPSSGPCASSSVGPWPRWRPTATPVCGAWSWTTKRSSRGWAPSWRKRPARPSPPTSSGVGWCTRRTRS
jgi:hypothetical protein